MYASMYVSVVCKGRSPSSRSIDDRIELRSSVWVPVGTVRPGSLWVVGTPRKGGTCSLTSKAVRYARFGLDIRIQPVHGKIKRIPDAGEVQVA